ncbi:hemoglobin subunit beta-2-like [Hyperolius riggenbachi]|uniref:hemoglobin subunit beta-2-like n=1 Tax=Hyperolius riggenbachi TaxID=752182 RepID=UPI0035A361D5
MVHFTDAEIKAIHGAWNKINHSVFGGEALARLLICYPWTRRYFSGFGNIGSPDAICHNTKVLAHGQTVLASVGEGLAHLDNLKGHYAKLSQHHSETLHVDPANFRLFADVLLVNLAHELHEAFNPDVHAAFVKAFSAIADALSRGYH